MPQRIRLFIVSVFAPTAQHATDYHAFPLLTQTRVGRDYYSAFKMAFDLLKHALSVGISVKVGITETHPQTPRYIVFYAAKTGDGNLALYTRKNQHSGFDALAADNYRQYFTRDNAQPFTNAVSVPAEHTINRT